MFFFKEKEVVIPKKKEDQKPRAFKPHDYVRNVMGASSGAGSGEFDIYRGCRRRELSRQEFIQQQAEKERIQKEFDELREKHLIEAMKKTEKKRAKRLKKKQKSKKKDQSSQEEDDEEEEKADEAEAEEEVEIDLYEKAAAPVEN